VIKAFQRAGERPHTRDFGRARAAVREIGIKYPHLAADLRPLIERLYVLDLLVRVG